MVPVISSLYIHIPFCAALCHYCDFAKSANFSDAHVAAYFSRIGADLKRDLEHYKPQLRTVFFGGGTPGLFAEEYAPIFELIQPYLSADGVEISLEANPDDITREKLALWRELGFNRLSIGVQSFQVQGLRALTRNHTADATIRNIHLAREYFDNLNIDLIYGWNGQTLADWDRDLQTAINLSIPHLSLYGLTFEPATPMGRKASRGLVVPAHDDAMFGFYEKARHILGDSDFRHEEISNWSKPNFSCQHNWAYWTDQSYLAIGAGAHGYIADEGIGRRYFYPKDFRSYLRVDAAAPDAGRDEESWLLEYLGSSLRTSLGSDLALIREKTGRKFAANAAVQKGIDEGLLKIDGNWVVLTSQEWFRETAWCVQVAKSLLLS